MSHLVETSYASSENYQKNLSDCVRAMLKIQDFREHYAIYEKLKKEVIHCGDRRTMTQLKIRMRITITQIVTDQPVRRS